MAWISRILCAVGSIVVAAVALAPAAEADLGPWSTVSGGGGHTCGITAGRTLYCWGNNASGQIGDSTSSNTRPNPTKIGATGVWTAAATGNAHTCGITTARNLYCWGNNGLGQVGDGSTGNLRPGLTKIGGSGVWTAIAVGNAHTCGITAAKNLYCWGNNSTGQIGDGTTGNTRPSPKKVGGSGVWTATTVGTQFTCGLTVAKNLYCWGSNPDGQIGDGTSGNVRPSPTKVGGSGVWTATTAGTSHTCGITVAKNLYCWGSNFFGQIGDGTSNNVRLSLTKIGGSGVWTSASAGSSHTCGITAAKNLYCWGSNNGRIGDGTTTERPAPTKVGGSGAWAAGAAGGAFTCGISSRYRFLSCWGVNNFGQLGDGTTTQRLSAPYLV